MAPRIGAYMSRRSRGRKLVFLVGSLLAVYLYFTDGPAFSHLPSYWDRFRTADHDIGCARHSHRVVSGRRLLASNESGSSYPEDLFTKEERLKGFVALHVFGMIYMFVALAIVCDEFFVPSLDVITERLGVSEDVAGATFMAAGGSAPELFTSIMGVFVSHSDVGIGTIVGSAVFNILFVIGMCAMFSKEILTLSWWPLFRDVTFYTISLSLLIGFFLDDKIEWWEALVLFLSYIAYGLFMKWNVALEAKTKGILNSCRKQGNKIKSDETRDKQTVAKLQDDQGNQLGATEADRKKDQPSNRRHSTVLRNARTEMNNMLPFSEGQRNSLTNDQLQEAKRQRRLSRDRTDTILQDIPNIQIVESHPTDAKLDNQSNDSIAVQTLKQRSSLEKETTDRKAAEDALSSGVSLGQIIDTPLSKQTVVNSPVVPIPSPVNPPGFNEDIVSEVEQPLDMSWPDTCGKRLTYLLLLPIMLPLFLTLPDVRKPNRRICFVWTFTGSIVWIAAYSYCMVWWANVAGSTVGIPDEVMGLTILAAGTSIPDLITSVIVAKKGFGDMAVSSSVGSNLFDITVGLPVPWLMYSAINGGAAYIVSSTGLLCSILLLFFMLLAVIACIVLSSWKMSKMLGFSMLALYGIFITLAVLLEYRVLQCPKL